MPRQGGARPSMQQPRSARRLHAACTTASVACTHSRAHTAKNPSLSLLSLPLRRPLQRREGELAELRGIVGALDAERDSLQAELDRRAELAAAQAGALAADRQRAGETERWAGSPAVENILGSFAQARGAMLYCCTAVHRGTPASAG